MGGSLGRNLGGAQGGGPKIFLSHNFIIFNILKVDIFKFDLDFDIDYSKRGSLLVRSPLGLVSWGVPWRAPLGPPLEIFFVSPGGRGPPSAPPQIYYGTHAEFCTFKFDSIHFY